jgi:hypothetical protein
MGKLTYDEVNAIVDNADCTISECLSWLDDNMDKVAPWAAKQFVPSVMRQAAKKGSAKLSTTQQAWMFKLRMDALTPQAPMKTLKLAKLVGLFASASENLKWPKITFQFTLSEELRKANRSKYGTDLRGLDTLTAKQAELMLRLFENDFTIRLSRAGEGSKNPGCIQIVGADRKWFGRIVDGVFHRVDHCPQDVVDFLKAFNSKATVISQFFGWNSGNCCYCNRLLSDDRSLDAGYGKTCAGHYNQPWG